MEHIIILCSHIKARTLRWHFSHMLAKHIARVFKQFHWLKYLKLDELVDYFDEFFLPKNFVNTFIKIICT